MKGPLFRQHLEGLRNDSSGKPAPPRMNGANNRFAPYENWYAIRCTHRNQELGLSREHGICLANTAVRLSP